MTTIDFQCGSAVKAFNLTAGMIKVGYTDLIIDGGLMKLLLKTNYLKIKIER